MNIRGKRELDVIADIAQQVARTINHNKNLAYTVNVSRDNTNGVTLSLYVFEDEGPPPVGVLTYTAQEEKPDFAIKTKDTDLIVSVTMTLKSILDMMSSNIAKMEAEKEPELDPHVDMLLAVMELNEQHPALRTLIREIRENPSAGHGPISFGLPGDRTTVTFKFMRGSGVVVHVEALHGSRWFKIATLLQQRSQLLFSTSSFSFSGDMTGNKHVEMTNALAADMVAMEYLTKLYNNILQAFVELNKE